MRRVVIDTNVVVSALLKPGGLEDRILKLALTGRLQMYVSKAVLDEYAEVLQRRKFKLRPVEAELVLAKIREVASMVQPTSKLSVSADEPDNRFLECAEAAAADYLVTGNTKHFPETYKTTQVVTARQLLAIIGR